MSGTEKSIFEWLFYGHTVFWLLGYFTVIQWQLCLDYLILGNIAQIKPFGFMNATDRKEQQHLISWQERCSVQYQVQSTAFSFLHLLKRMTDGVLFTSTAESSQGGLSKWNEWQSRFYWKLWLSRKCWLGWDSSATMRSDKIINRLTIVYV